MLETDRSAESRLHLTGDVEMVEDRLCALIEFDNLRALGCNQLQIMTHFVVDTLVVDLNSREIRAEHITDDTEGASHLLTDQTDRLFFLKRLNRLFPPLHEQSQLVVQLSHTFVFRYRTNNDAETLRFDRKHQLFKTLAFCLAFNLLADHHAVCKGNENDVTSCHRDLGSEARALGVDRLFRDLHQNRVAHFEHIGYLSLFAHFGLTRRLVNQRNTASVRNGFGHIRLQRTKLRT